MNWLNTRQGQDQQDPSGASYTTAHHIICSQFKDRCLSAISSVDPSISHFYNPVFFLFPFKVRAPAGKGIPTQQPREYSTVITLKAFHGPWRLVHLTKLPRSCSVEFLWPAEFLYGSFPTIQGFRKAASPVALLSWFLYHLTAPLPSQYPDCTTWWNTSWTLPSKKKKKSLYILLYGT